jgi:hypothetical protein
MTAMISARTLIQKIFQMLKCPRNKSQRLLAKFPSMRIKKIRFPVRRREETLTIRIRTTNWLVQRALDHPPIESSLPEATTNWQRKPIQGQGQIPTGCGHPRPGPSSNQALAITTHRLRRLPKKVRSSFQTRHCNTKKPRRKI